MWHDGTVVSGRPRRWPNARSRRPSTSVAPTAGSDPQAVGWTRCPLHRANLPAGDGPSAGSTGASSRTASASGCRVLARLRRVCAVWVLDRETGRPGARRGPTARPRCRSRLTSEASPASTPVVCTWSCRCRGCGRPHPDRRRPGRRGRGESRASWCRGQPPLPVPSRTGRLVRGTVRLDGTPYDVVGRAVLDHGRGKWPHAITWNWAAGFPEGRDDTRGEPPGITLGGKWTDGTGPTENGLFVDGVLHKIGDEPRGVRPLRLAASVADPRAACRRPSRSTTAPTAPSSAASPTRPTSASALQRLGEHRRRRAGRPRRAGRLGRGGTQPLVTPPPRSLSVRRRRAPRRSAAGPGRSSPRLGRTPGTVRRSPAP